MMRVECGWCGADLGVRQGPAGEVSHGICKPCQALEVAKFRRPFSIGGRAVAGLVLGLLLLLYGWAGECDRQDAEAYERLRGEMVASAETWVVRR